MNNYPISGTLVRCPAVTYANRTAWVICVVAQNQRTFYEHRYVPIDDSEDVAYPGNLTEGPPSVRFFNVVLMGGPAESIAALHLGAGDGMDVVGTMQEYTWATDDCERRTTIVADNVRATVGPSTTGETQASHSGLIEMVERVWLPYEV